MRQHTAPDVDLLLGGRYRLLHRIAGGGMGDVWCASDESLGRVVAVKILRRELAHDPTFLARFRAEARHTAALSHAGIATVYDYSDGARDEVGQPFLVMEYVPGEPLSQILQTEGALGADRTLDLVAQTAFALQAAHDAGVVHRDVKPGNLLVTPDGRVKVSDFGISRAQGSVPLTQTGAIMGTAYYLSPEQASGRPVSPASDLYSLGVVAYECLSGRKPFLGDTPVGVALAQVSDEVPALPATVDPAVRGLVMRLLAKDPAERPASAGAVGRAALALRDGLLVGTDLDVAGIADADRTITLPAVPAVLPVAGPDGPPRPAYTGAPTDPAFALPPAGRVPAWLPYVVASLAVAVLVGIAAYALVGVGDTTGGVGTHATQQPVGTVTGVTSTPSPTSAAATTRRDNSGPGNARDNGQGNGQGNGGDNSGPGNARDRQGGGR